MGAQIYFDNYSPVGDLLVVAMCMVIFVLISASYVNKTRIFAIYINIVVYLMTAALLDVLHHNLYAFVTDGNYTLVYVLRVIYHGVLFSNLLLYVVYVVEMLHLEKDKKIPIMALSTITYFMVIGVDVVTTIKGTGFRLNESGKAVSGNNIFLYGYLVFMAIIIFLLVAFRKLVFKRVMLGFYGTIAISFLLLYLQGKHGQSSFTVGAFLLPTVAMLYMLHSNPYDIELGAINAKAMTDMIEYHYRRKNPLILMSLYLPDFDMEGLTFTKELQKTIRTFSSEFFKDAVLFRISNGHVILVAEQKKNPGYRHKVDEILEGFQEEYEKFRLDYKIVMGESIDEISRKNEYIRFIKSIHQTMKMNEVHRLSESDVATFEEYEYILSQLSDIHKRGDLEDERVRVYCQPVYNLKTRKYDTAEALMRLQLPNKGLVFPDKFIALAEENGYIHSLTKVILKKTCDQIREMLQECYEVNRISVNVSILEMREEGFSTEISELIRQSGIPEEKVAIEITESRSDNDFVMIKSKINQLKDRGIKFYLDDFGTGYSNMERILELPFDIIKFDRSLVIASDANKRSEKMIGSLANMFSDLHYAVLYEGVETQGDEERCMNMSANYLQGYKYSRPIPIEELRKFFSKIAG